jgi:acetolactate synthase-like protein
LNLFEIKIISKKKQIGNDIWIFISMNNVFFCRQKGLEPTKDHLNPVHVLQQLEDQLPDNAILVGDGGDFVAIAAYVLRPRGPLTWLDPGAFGTLGVGAGFALGAKLVRPEASVWIVYGDGALGYSIMEYDTFVRHKVCENLIHR